MKSVCYCLALGEIPCGPGGGLWGFTKSGRATQRKARREGGGNVTDREKEREREMERAALSYTERKSSGGKMPDI